MLRNIATISLIFLFSTSALAHFPWLTTDGQGHVQLCFGESPAERNYKLPESVAKAKIVSVHQAKTTEVKTQKVESDDFIGLKSTEPASDKHFMTQMTYGIYAGSRLDYYASHQIGPLPKDRKAYALPTKETQDGAKKGQDSKSKAPALQVQLVDTDQGVDAFVVWKDEPVVGAKVTLFCEAGHEEASARTDEAGKVSFTDQEVEEGLNGIMVGHNLEDVQGTWEGNTYKTWSHYLTATFYDPEEVE